MEKVASIIMTPSIESVTLITKLLSEKYLINAINLTPDKGVTLAYSNRIDAISNYFDIRPHQMTFGEFTFLSEDYLTRELFTDTILLAMAKQFNSHIFRDSYNTGKYEHIFPSLLAKTITVAVGGSIRMLVPFIRSTLRDVVKCGIQLNAPFELSYSCLDSMESPCGLCKGCKDRIQAFSDNRSLDPFSHQRINDSNKVISESGFVPPIYTKTEFSSGASDAMASDQRVNIPTPKLSEIASDAMPASRGIVYTNEPTESDVTQTIISEVETPVIPEDI